jgi:glycine cleavage system H protein
VESVKAVNALYMPIAGKVLEVNSALSDAPTLVNAEPYARGWMIKINIPENADQSLLLSAVEYRKALESS